LGQVRGSIISDDSTILVDGTAGTLTASTLTGSVPDASIAESSVTQHEAALSITQSQISDIGNFTFSASTLDTSDSSGIVITPAVTVSSDLTVENSLTVTNNITADTLNVTTLYYDNLETSGAGTPEIESDGAIALTAGTRVEISSSPIKMASFTTAERDALSATNGDMIYNSTTNKFQGYAAGAWVDLH